MTSLSDMQPPQKNYAYIDGNNLHQGIKSSGWALDYVRFRKWLSEKYGVQKAYLFIGLIPKEKKLYTFLQNAGYTLVFKEVVYDGTGKPKGNCDAELVLNATVDLYEKRFTQAVIVTSDGDYGVLVELLKERGAFRILLSPSRKCSYLLRKLNIPIVYLETQQRMLAWSPKKEKAPGGDGTPQGSSSW